MITDQKLREILHDAQGEQARDQILYSWITDNMTPTIKLATDRLQGTVRGRGAPMSFANACQVIAMVAVEQWKYYEEHPGAEPNVTLR